MNGGKNRLVKAVSKIMMPPAVMSPHPRICIFRVFCTVVLVFKTVTRHRIILESTISDLFRARFSQQELRENGSLRNYLSVYL